MSLPDHKLGALSRRIAVCKRALAARPLLLSGGLALVVSLVFWFFPGIDHTVTGWYYSNETWFPARTDPLLNGFRHFGIELSRGIAIWTLSLVVIRILFWRFPAVLSGRALAFLVSCAALGPGLLINVFLKDFWGRPRPHMVQDYGGGAPYVKVWEISDYCFDNCSFVSGEAASSFWPIAFAFLLPKEMRAGFVTIVCLLSATLSLNRIAFGGHFLSDVTISWCLTLFVILAMKKLILDRGAGGPDPYDDFLTGIGRKSWGLIGRKVDAA